MLAGSVSRRPPVGDRLQQSLRDVMRPGVVVVGIDATLGDVQRALLTHGVHAILVLERTGRPLGWATPAGVLRLAERDAEAARAPDAVTEEAIALGPWQTARDALDVMRREGAHRVLVASSDGRLPEGVVAEHDLLAVLLG